MRFTGVVHAGFTVSDLDRSLHWYTEILGLELVKRQRVESSYIGTIVGFDDAVLEIGFLRLPGVDPAPSSHVLELIQYLTPAGRGAPGPNTQVGSGHLALIVADIATTYSNLLDAGVSFVNPPVEISEGANKGAWACYLHDPDGITVELIQPAERGVPNEHTQGGET
jgi:lactoylglutathione lyase